VKGKSRERYVARTSSGRAERVWGAVVCAVRGRTGGGGAAAMAAKYEYMYRQGVGATRVCGLSQLYVCRDCAVEGGDRGSNV
jgi:hypothetical protein